MESEWRVLNESFKKDNLDWYDSTVMVQFWSLSQTVVRSELYICVELIVVLKGKLSVNIIFILKLVLTSGETQ